MNGPWLLWVALTVGGGVLGNAAWAMLCSSGRLLDRRVPNLALWLACRATQMLPEEQRNDPLYNFESDAYEALQGGHRYSALGTSVRAVAGVSLRGALRKLFWFAAIAGTVIVTAIVVVVAGVNAVAGDNAIGSFKRRPE